MIACECKSTNSSSITRIPKGCLNLKINGWRWRNHNSFRNICKSNLIISCIRSCSTTSTSKSPRINWYLAFSWYWGYINLNIIRDSYFYLSINWNFICVLKNKIIGCWWGIHNVVIRYNWSCSSVNRPNCWSYSCYYSFGN